MPAFASSVRRASNLMPLIFPAAGAAAKAAVFDRDAKVKVTLAKAASKAAKAADRDATVKVTLAEAAAKAADRDSKVKVKLSNIAATATEKAAKYEISDNERTFLHLHLALLVD